MSMSGHSGPASPDPDELRSVSSRPESRSSISSDSIGMGNSSHITSTMDDSESRASEATDHKKSKISSEDVIALDENAQSGGLLEEKAQANKTLEKLRKSEKAFDSLELVSDDDMETSDSFRENHQSSNERKSQTEDPLLFKDNELDFEGDPEEDETSKTVDTLKNKPKNEDSEEGECDDGTQDGKEDGRKKDEEDDESKEAEELEEGEVSSDEDVGKHSRMEPRPVCRFYSKGNCTWGSNCRFVHPGVLDKGNYNMFAPARPAHSTGPPSFDRAPFERPAHAQPPPDWVSIAPRPGPRLAAREAQGGDPAVRGEPESAESAWERGLRQAKEMLKKSNQRKETDVDFEEKRLNLGLGEDDLDKENDYYTRPASPIQKDRPPIEELDVEPYPKYPPAPMERRLPGRYPPPLPPPGYPPPFDHRRAYGDPEFREYYRGDPYERPFYGPKRGERDYEGPYQQGKMPPPFPPERRWQDERYVEVNQASVQRGRADEWHDPWMRSKSPPPTGGAKGGRHRSYSSGSSISTSSSTSRSSSYSSSSRSSSRSSISSRSISRSRSRSPTPRAGKHTNRGPRKDKGSGRGRKAGATEDLPKSGPDYRSKHAGPPARPISPADNFVMRKPPPGERSRGQLERVTPPRQRSWSSGSSRSRSKSRSRLRSRSPSPPTSRQPQKRSAPGAKPQSRPRSVSRSSSSSASFDSSSDSDRDERRKRGRRDFAERKELRNPVPRASQASPPGEAPSKGRTVESAKDKEPKQQIKLTLKSSAPTLKKVPNKFADDSDEEAKQNAAAVWEKEKQSANHQPAAASTAGPQGRKRSAESPSPPHSKIGSATSPAKSADKDKSKKAAAIAQSRREELLKQLKAVEDAIARKRQKI